MTPQEQQLLQDLTAKINSTVLPDKDPEAEQFLNGTLGRNPDAAYIMAQTILVQNYALDQAKQQLEQMKQQAQQQQPQQSQQKHTSFLGNLLGMNDSRDTPAPPPPVQQGYAPPPNYGAPQYGPPMQYGQPAASGGFLRSAMQTATGVAAGALAFEGIESLMHGFGNHAGYGGSGFGGFDGAQPREEIVNNYYGDSDRAREGSSHETGGSFGDRLSQSDGGSGAASPDLEDRRDDRSSFADSDDSVSDNDDSSNTSDDSGSDNFDPTGGDNSF